MLTYHDVEQNTEEWYAMRSGKLTSSNLGKVMANMGKAFGDPAKKYAVQIAIEQITGKPISSNFSNSHMERGCEQEPVARDAYENETFSTVSNGGFFSSGEIGCSPDGLVLDNGVIEIKCVIESTHYANVRRQNVDPAYKWQCIGNMKFTGRDWIDFVSYCSTYPSDKQLYIYRMHKSDYTAQYDQIDERVNEFMFLVAKTKAEIQSSEYCIN